MNLLHSPSLIAGAWFFFASCSNMPLLTVSTDDGTCFNDSNFSFTIMGNDYDCIAVGSDDEENRYKHCQIDAVKASCPVSCGLCCEDDFHFQFMQDSGDTKKCNFIETNNKQEKYCNREVATSKLISDYCPKACGTCPDVATDTGFSTCQNDPSFILLSPSGIERNCNNIGKVATRRHRLCQDEAVQEACPYTCGLCCEDDASYSFELDSQVQYVDCSWISNASPEKEILRIDRYCDAEKNGSIVKKRCVDACKNCFEAVLFPTSAPSSSVPSTSSTSEPSPRPATHRPTLSEAPTKQEVLQFAIRWEHACISHYGDVSCVGRNYLGMAGADPASSGFSLLTPHAISYPNEPVIPYISKVVTGFDHTSMIDDQGYIYSFGRNVFSVISSDSSLENSFTPIKHTEPKNAKDIEAGAYHVCVILRENSSMLCWGRNLYGEISDPPSTAVSEPTVFYHTNGSSDSTSARLMTLGNYHTCVILVDNKLFCAGVAAAVGENEWPSPIEIRSQDEINTGVTILKIVAGNTHTCILLSNRKAKCFGNNSSGELGNGQYSDSYTTVDPEGYVKTETSADLEGIIDIAANGYATCAVIENGVKVVCWGNGSRNGLLGSTTTPVDVNRLSSEILNERKIVSIYLGSSTGHVLLDDNSLLSWGTNTSGQFGNGSIGYNAVPMHLPCEH